MCYSIGSNDGSMLPMVKMNLAKEYVITEIRLYGRGDSNEGFPAQVGILTNDDGVGYARRFPTKTITMPTVGTPYIYVLPQEIVTDTLGIEAVGGLAGTNAALMLSEVEIYGYSREDQNQSSVKLDSSILDTSAYFRKDMRDNSSFSIASESLYNGNYTEQVILPNAGTFDGEYNKQTIKIDFNDGKKYVITKVKVYSTWDGNEFPDNIIVYSNDGEKLSPYVCNTHKGALSWNGVSAPYEIDLYDFPESSGLALELRCSEDKRISYKIGEIEVFGYEYGTGTTDEDISSSQYTAKSAHRDYGNSQAITVGTTEISHQSFPISNLFDGDLTNMWTQNVPITEGYTHLKPFVMMNFNAGQRYVVTEIQIYPRGDGVNWPKSIKAAVTEDGSNYTDIYSADNVATPSPNTPYIINLANNTVSCSGIGIELSGSDANGGIYMSDIAEIKIKGHLVDTALIKKQPIFSFGYHAAGLFATHST